jgi:hypothetical protein
VITFAGFIIVSQHASPVGDERQTILKPMNRGLQRSWQSPNNHLDKRARAKNVPFVNEQLGAHVGVNTNRCRMPSIPALRQSWTGGRSKGCCHSEKLVPQPQEAVAIGLLILNEAPIRSST